MAIALLRIVAFQNPTVGHSGASHFGEYAKKGLK